MSEVIAVVLARWGATRLPGKMGMPIGEAASAVHLTLDRLRGASSVGSVVLATSTNPLDDAIATVGDELGLRVFRGSEDDVVARIHGAVTDAPEPLVARVNADNPLHFPEVLDAAVRHLDASGGELVTPFEANTLPFGAGPVVMTRACLDRIHTEATSATYREHVENFCFEHPDQFSVRYQRAGAGQTWRELLLTLDYAVDLARLRRFDRLLAAAEPTDQLRWLVRWGTAAGAALELRDTIVIDPAFVDLEVDRFGEGPSQTFGLRYTDPAIAGPSAVLLDDQPAASTTPRDFLLRHESRIRRTVPGGPLRPVAMAEGGFPPAEKQHADATRRGFQSPASLRAPPRLYIEPHCGLEVVAAVRRYLALHPVQQVLAPQLAHADALRALVPERVLGGPGATAAWSAVQHLGPFAGVRIHPDGTASTPSAPERGRIDDGRLTAWWTGPTLWHHRAAWLDTGKG